MEVTHSTLSAFHFDVQEMRQFGLMLSSTVWENALVLAGVDLSQLCGASLPDGV